MMTSSRTGGIHTLATIVAHKGKVLRALDTAVDYCGYNLTEVMGMRTRQRVYADLRSVVWAIYQGETKLSAQQIGIDFGWNRGTVFSAIERARALRLSDRNFSDIYDAIHGAYVNALSMQSTTATESNSSNNTKNA